MTPGPGTTQDLRGVDVQEWAEYGSGNVQVLAASGAACALPTAEAESTSLITLTAACAMTVPPPVLVGEKRRVYLTQDATGSRVVTWTFTGGTCAWQAAAAPTLTTTPAHTDYVELESLDGVNWLGKYTLNFH
jgi:hypothetical protein